MIKEWIKGQLKARGYVTKHNVPDFVLNGTCKLSANLRSELEQGFIDFGCLWPDLARIKWAKYLEE